MIGQHQEHEKKFLSNHTCQSRWPYDERSIQRRQQNEQQWVDDWNLQLEKRYTVDVNHFLSGA